MRFFFFFFFHPLSRKKLFKCVHLLKVYLSLYTLRVDDLKAYSYGLKATHYRGCVNNRMIHLELQKKHIWRHPAHLHNFGLLYLKGLEINWSYYPQMVLAQDSCTIIITSLSSHFQTTLVITLKAQWIKPFVWTQNQEPVFFDFCKICH